MTSQHEIIARLESPSRETCQLGTRISQEGPLGAHSLRLASLLHFAILNVRVLILEDSQADRIHLERIVNALGYEASVAKNGIEARDMIQMAPPDIVLVDSSMPEMSGTALTRLIREMDGRKYVYVVFVGKNSIGAMCAAFVAGADDFLAKPVHKDELEARLRAAQRIVKLEGRLRDRVDELESALRRLQVSAAMKGGVVASASIGPPPHAPSVIPPPGELSDIPAFGCIDDTVRRALSEFLGGEFTESPSRGLPVAFDAAITLTSVGLGLEITLGFSVDRSAADAISTHLFGAAEDDAMMKDMMAEIANTVMGGVKASFIAGGENLTAGIPRSATGEATAEVVSTHPWTTTLVFARDEVVITSFVAARERPTRELRAKHLAEGMVLAKDVKADNGTLLVTAATRVTATLAERLHRIAPEVKVRIIDSAA